MSTTTTFTRVALAAGLACQLGAALAQAPTTPGGTPPVPPVQPAEPTLDVSRYRIDGTLPIPAASVEQALAPFTGKARTLRDLEGAAQALERRLRDAGYAFHRIIVPAQRPQDGEVRLQVVEFRLGKVDVQGNQHFDTANIRASLPTLKEGEPPQLEQLGSDVSASNTNPAKQVSVSFRESREPNAVDAVVRVQDTPPVAFIASMTANQHISGGGESNNVVRVTGAFQHSNLFNRDHVLTLSYSTDPRHVSSLSLFGAYYQLPLYGTGMTASAYHTQSDTNAGRIQQGGGFFDVSGSGRFQGARLSRAMERIGTLQPTLAVALDDRVFENSTTFNGVQIQPDVGSRVLTLLAGLRDEAGWGNWSANIEHLANLGGGSRNTAEAHAANGGVRGWRAWRYSADAVAPVGGWQVVGRVRGQHSGDNLVAGEQFGLGGYNSVRGFADRVVAGERGWQWNLEATGPALGTTGLRPVVFTDGGQVRPLGGGPSETIASAGAGVRWLRPGLQVAADLAQVVNDASTSQGSKPLRLNLGVVSRF